MTRIDPHVSDSDHLYSTIGMKGEVLKVTPLYHDVLLDNAVINCYRADELAVADEVKH